MADKQDDVNASENPNPPNISWKDAQDEKLSTANKAHQGEGLPLNMLRNALSGNINIPGNMEVIKTFSSLPDDLTPFEEQDRFFRAYEELFTTNMNRLPRIFVSHSHTDNGFCAHLVQDLRAVLRDESAVWCDMQEGLHGGDVWWDKVVGELSTRNIFIVVLSPEAVNSRQVRYEINIALDKNMFIIPLLLHNCVVHPDLQNITMISFHTFKTYDVAFKELLLVMGVSLDEGTRKIKNKFIDHKALLAQSITRMIEVAFAKNHWYDVLRKVNYLVEQTPGFVTAVIYRMQALSLAKSGYELLALEALDVALALVSDEAVYLMLLEDYATILTSLSRWIDLVRLVDEALQLVPDDVAWLKRQEQVYSQLEPLTNIKRSQAETEHPASPGAQGLSTTLENPEDEYELSLTNRDNGQRKGVFISYSYSDKDKTYLQELHTHLTSYERTGLVEVWDNTKMTAGQKWTEEVLKALTATEVVVVLISKDFLASKFIYENELPLLLDAESKGKTRILPVILGRCAFDDSPLAPFHPINKPDEPLAELKPGRRDGIWVKLVDHIIKLVRDA